MEVLAHASDGARSCTKCLVNKPLDAFRLHPKGRFGRTSECVECLRLRGQEYRRRNLDKAREAQRAYEARHPDRVRQTQVVSLRVTRWHTALVARSRDIARRRGIAFDLDAEFVLDLFERQGRRCFWLGLELQPSVDVRGAKRPSLDRLDPKRGYTKDNVVIASQFANMGRSTMSAESFRTFLDELREHWR